MYPRALVLASLLAIVSGAPGCLHDPSPMDDGMGPDPQSHGHAGHDAGVPIQPGDAAVPPPPPPPPPGPRDSGAPPQDAGRPTDAGSDVPDHVAPVPADSGADAPDGSAPVDAGPEVDDAPNEDAGPSTPDADAAVASDGGGTGPCADPLPPYPPEAGGRCSEETRWCVETCFDLTCASDCVARDATPPLDGIYTCGNCLDYVVIQCIDASGCHDAWAGYSCCYDAMCVGSDDPGCMEASCGAEWDALAACYAALDACYDWPSAGIYEVCYSGRVA